MYSATPTLDLGVLWEVSYLLGTMYKLGQQAVSLRSSYVLLKACVLFQREQRECGCSVGGGFCGAS